ncbi:ABC transporter permease [Streptomyces sp. NPDC058459]|uniref:ABC transporter permease n=1 Tax=Streptomyces sp. NPDC058459 TaxID=3346508 RepID=UPI0036636A97
MSMTGTYPRKHDALRPARRSTTAYGRISAIGRTELTLLMRNKSAVFIALFMPVLLTFSFRAAAEEFDLAGTGLDVTSVLLPSAIGFVLLFAVYNNLTTAFVARREELVLKRLRTGELSDNEILLGTATPMLFTGLVQMALLGVGGTLALDAGAPSHFWWLIAGVLTGLVIAAGLAALTASYSRTVETAGITVLPLMLVSAFGSGMLVPTELLPDAVVPFLEFFPLSPVVALIREGWTGRTDTTEMLLQLLGAIAWSAVAVVATRRIFRWEPRR